jgi:hypothetical protein
MDKTKETFDKQKLNQRIVTKLNFDVIDYSGFYNSIKELDQYRVCGNCKHAGHCLIRDRINFLFPIDDRFAGKTPGCNGFKDKEE